MSKRVCRLAMLIEDKDLDGVIEALGDMWADLSEHPEKLSWWCAGPSSHEVRCDVSYIDPSRSADFHADYEKLRAIQRGG